MIALNQLLSQLLLWVVERFLAPLGTGWKLLTGAALIGLSLALQNLLHLIGVGEPLHGWVDYALSCLLFVGGLCFGGGIMHKLYLAVPKLAQPKNGSDGSV